MFAAFSTFSTSSSLILCKSNEIVPLGFAIKSTAPYSIAWSVVSVPFCVVLDNITTATGVSIIICFNASNPFISGISTSSVTTSGFNAFIFRMASFPFRAIPTTSITLLSLKKSPMSLRINAESSTINNFFFGKEPLAHDLLENRFFNRDMNVLWFGIVVSSASKLAKLCTICFSFFRNFSIWI